MPYRTRDHGVEEVRAFPLVAFHLYGEESVRHLVSLDATKGDIEKYNRALGATEVASKFNVHRIRSLLCRLTKSSLLKYEPPLSARCITAKSQSTWSCSVLSKTLALSCSRPRQRTDELAHQSEPARVRPQRFDVPTSHPKGWLFLFLPYMYTEKDTARLRPEEEKEMLGRTPYRRDYGRLLHSPSFRRLQGKTQLFPGSESDFFRNCAFH